MMTSESDVVQLDEASEIRVTHTNRLQVETDSRLSVSSSEEHLVGNGYAGDLRSIPEAVCSIHTSLSIRTLSRRQTLILCCLALTELTSQMCLSIMAPFFPSEASQKGVSSTLSGWIFAIFALIQFAVSPLIGRIIPHFGSRLLIVTGQFLGGGCIVLFGFLDRIGSADDNDVFIAYCFVLRIVLAIGCTASTTSGFAITASVFPDHIATIFGLLETATGLGMMVGPAFGGVMYQFGGFSLPFVVLGALMILAVPLHLLWLPSTDGITVGVRSVSVLRILRIPAIIVICSAVVIAALAWSILDPTLAPHIHASDSEINSSILGLLFLLLSAFYAVFSPVWGWLADHMSNCLPMLAGGFLLSGVGLLLLGPSPWLGFFGFTETDEPLWLNIISLVILGVSISLSLVPTFDKILDAVEKAGIEDSFAMYSAVAGIWSSCYALGDFVGPALGGWLVDRPGGFVWCVTYVAVACFAMATVVILLWFFESREHYRSFSVRETCLFCVPKLTAASDQPALTSSDTYFTNERTALLARPPSVTNYVLVSVDHIHGP